MSDSKDGAISVPEPSPPMNGASIYVESPPFRWVSTIAAHPECFAILAIVLIWAGTFLAIYLKTGRI